MAFDFEKWAAKEKSDAVICANKKVERARKTLHFWTVLKHSGFVVPESPGGYELAYGFTVKVDREELPKIQETFGRLETAGYELDDAEKATVACYCKPKNWSDIPIRFQYLKTLSVEQRCKIVTVTPQASAPYKTLVCNSEPS
jgi:hypothetical protein